MGGTLVLVRHGQSEWNLKNLFTGWRDVGLSEQGIAEAKQAAARHFVDIFELPPWVTPPGEYDAPKTRRDAHDSTVVGVGFDPYAFGHGISKAIRTRRAHAEVIQAITEYCAAHRDEPGAAGICGGPPR